MPIIIMDQPNMASLTLHMSELEKATNKSSIQTGGTGLLHDTLAIQKFRQLCVVNFWTRPSAQSKINKLTNVNRFYVNVYDPLCNVTTA